MVGKESVVVGIVFVVEVLGTALVKAGLAVVGMEQAAYSVNSADMDSSRVVGSC